MQTGRPHIRIRYSGPRSGAPATGWFGRSVAVVAGVFVVAAALVFSLVLVAVLLTAGVVFGGYLWWKTRAVRRQMREQIAAMQAAAAAQGGARQDVPGTATDQGEVIDGEYTRVTASEDLRRGSDPR
jgi:hypothetical protein